MAENTCTATKCGISTCVQCELGTKGCVFWRSSWPEQRVRLHNKVIYSIYMLLHACMLIFFTKSCKKDGLLNLTETSSWDSSYKHSFLTLIWLTRVAVHWIISTFKVNQTSAKSTWCCKLQTQVNPIHCVLEHWRKSPKTEPIVSVLNRELLFNRIVTPKDSHPEWSTSVWVSALPCHSTGGCRSCVSSVGGPAQQSARSRWRQWKRRCSEGRGRAARTWLWSRSLSTLSRSILICIRNGDSDNAHCHYNQTAQFSSLNRDVIAEECIRCLCKMHNIGDISNMNGGVLTGQ